MVKRKAFNKINGIKYLFLIGILLIWHITSIKNSVRKVPSRQDILLAKSASSDDLAMLIKK